MQLLSASDLYISIPELLKYTVINSEILLNEYSENLKPKHWTLIANKVAEKVRSGKYQGVIVSHGTDTMHYTASALSFALQNFHSCMFVGRGIIRQTFLLMPAPKSYWCGSIWNKVGLFWSICCDACQFF